MLKSGKQVVGAGGPGQVGKGIQRDAVAIGAYGLTPAGFSCAIAGAYSLCAEFMKK